MSTFAERFLKRRTAAALYGGDQRVPAPARSAPPPPPARAPEETPESLGVALTADGLIVRQPKRRPPLRAIRVNLDIDPRSGEGARR